MSTRIIDLSVPLENDVKADPPGAGPSIQYYAHGDLVPMLRGYFPGLARADLPDGEGWAIEQINLSTHNGTHLDAPWHYTSTMDGGKPAATIDEIPLDWCYRPGVKLDFRSLPDGHVVSAAEVEAELARIGHKLQPLDIVVVNTAAGKRYGQPDYVDTGCGMGREATLYLTSRGVRVTGTDGWSWDAPFVHTARRYRDEGRVDHLGGTQGRPRDRILPYREASQSRSPAGDRISGRVFPGEDPPRVRRLDPGRRHIERVIWVAFLRLAAKTGGWVFLSPTSRRFAFLAG
jgi:kynurenine formamidase